MRMNFGALLVLVGVLAMSDLEKLGGIASSPPYQSPCPTIYCPPLNPFPMPRPLPDDLKGF